MKKIIIVIFFSVFSSAVYGVSKQTCDKKSLKFLIGGKPQELNVDLCINKSLSMIFSSSCLSSKGCKAFKAFKQAISVTTESSSTAANPYFLRCKLRGGEPRIYLLNSKEVALCGFNDGSFVNVTF